VIFHNEVGGRGIEPTARVSRVIAGDPEPERFAERFFANPHTHRIIDHSFSRRKQLLRNECHLARRTSRGHIHTKLPLRGPNHDNKGAAG